MQYFLITSIMSHSCIEIIFPHCEVKIVTLCEKYILLGNFIRNPNCCMIFFVKLRDIGIVACIACIAILHF